MMSSFVSIGQTPPRLPFFLMIVSRARDAMLFVDPCLRRPWTRLNRQEVVYSTRRVRGYEYELWLKCERVSRLSMFLDRCGCRFERCGGGAFTG